MDKLYYAGIGSRQTPTEVCELMTQTANYLEGKTDYILRSGGADGADKAFEAGIIIPTKKEIWLPWEGFNGNSSIYVVHDDAFKIAKDIHPKWNGLSEAAKKLHARNCHQVLGEDLQTPCKFVICWTEGGKAIGGTRTAIVLAKLYNIRVLNLGKYTTHDSRIDAIEDLFLMENIL